MLSPIEDLYTVKNFHAARALHGLHRTRALRDIFDTLLWTAFVQVHRGRKPLPPSVQDWRSLRPNVWTTQTLEAKYGIGEYSERKALLHDALDALLRKRLPVDIEKIYHILFEAKCSLAFWYEMENALDDQRAVESERFRCLTNLQHWAYRTQRFLHQERARPKNAQIIARSLRPAQVAPPGGVFLPLKLQNRLEARQARELVQRLDALVANLRHALHTTPARYRRDRCGPPSPKAIMRPSLKSLAKAGATGWIRTSLLDATGLTLLANKRT